MVINTFNCCHCKRERYISKTINNKKYCLECFNFINSDVSKKINKKPIKKSSRKYKAQNEIMQVKLI